MRVALKIAAWMILVLLAVQVMMGLARLDREAKIVEQELQRDHRIVGSALVAAVEHQAGDLAQSQALLQEIELAEREIELELSLASVQAPSQAIQDGLLVTDLDVRLPSGPARLRLREPMSELERVSQEGRRQLLLSGGLLLALGLLAAASTGRFVVGKRMERLLGRAVEIGNGDLSPRAPLHGRDELTELGIALETLASNLEQARVQAQQEQAAREQAVEQLRHADRLRLVGDLAAGVAHELGSPLHVISGNARYLSSAQGLTPELQETADDIRDQAERMTHLVRDLLELAHPKPPSGSLEPLPQIWGDLRSTGEGLVRGTRVRMELSPPPQVYVHVRPALLVQAMANLMRNAVQAQSERGGAVQVSALPVGDHVELRVDDQGPGVPPELRESVLAPFYTTKPPGQGLGLGLPLVQGIVEEAGGTLRIEDAPSGGARFVISLPAESP